VWLGLGAMIYIVYGRHHSVLALEAEAESKSS
jgi:hypothetical protein